jgi:hypothetical protein
LVLLRAVAEVDAAVLVWNDVLEVMTSEDKRDRRKARQEVEAAFRSLLRRRMGLYATNRQIEAAVKVMADRYYAEQVRPTAERIERELIAKAEEKAAVAV